MRAVLAISKVLFLLCALCLHRKRYNKKSNRVKLCCSLKGGESAGARTRDPNIKSVVLYLLSYGFSKGANHISGGKGSKYF